MGINVYPQPSNIGKPPGAKDLIFGGYSSIGAYNYTGTIPAGNYIAEIRLATTNSLAFVGSGPNSTTSPVTTYSITGNNGSTYASGIIPTTFQPVGSNASNNWLYTPVADYTHIRIPSTDTGITISGGYTTKTGTTVSTWTQSTSNVFNVFDITCLDAEGSNIIIGTGPADGFNYRYFNPELLETFDNGDTWTRRYGMNDFVSSTWPINSFSSEISVFSNQSTDNIIKYAGGRYFYLNSSSSGPRMAWSDDLNSWQTSNHPNLSNASGNPMSDVAYNTVNESYAALGRVTANTNAYTAISPDGTIFNNTDTTGSLSTGIAYGNGVYVVSSTGAFVRRSTDGITWASVASTSDLRRGIYATRFVFNGNGNYFGHSTDGITWASVAAGFSASGQNTPRTVAYGNGVYVAGNGKGEISRSTDGITWSSTGITTNITAGNGINSIAYGASIFALVGNNGVIRTSTDGLVWATRTSNVTNDIVAMDYGHKGFFAYTFNEFKTLLSTDGITWSATVQASAPSPIWSSVSGIQKKQYSFVAKRVQLSSTSTTNVGQMWGSSYSGAAGFNSNSISITSSGNVFLTNDSQYGDMRAFYSYPNGNNTSITIFGKQPTSLRRSYYNAGTNTISDFGGSAPLTRSLSGNSYGVMVNAAISVPQRSIYVIAGEKGSLATTTTPESGFTIRTSNFGATRINALTFGGLFIAGGDSGQLRTSTDAVTWTTRTSGFGSNAIRALTWNGSIYIAAGQSGTLTTSTDGVTWTVRTSTFETNDILCITPSVLAKFPVPASPPTVTAIGGKNGSFAISTDGITWTKKSVPYYSLSIQELNYNGSQYYAVATMAPYRTGKYFTVPSNAYPYSSFNSTSYPPFLLARSTDGITWSTVESYTGSMTSGSIGTHMPSLQFKTGAGYVLTFNNGATWTTTASISYGPVIRSTDGITWSTVSTTIVSYQRKKVKLVNNNFFVWGDTSGSSLTDFISQSTNGITWSTVTAPSTSLIRDISYENGNYIFTGAYGNFFYTSTDLSLYIPRGISNVYLVTYDSSTSRYIAFTETGLTYTSADLITWTQGVSLGYSYPYKAISAGTGKFIVTTGQAGNFYPFLGGSSEQGYNINEVALYGDPTSGWMPIVPSSSSTINSITDGGFAYNSTNSRVISSFGPLTLQYGTLGSGTVSFGTSVPSFIYLYSTEQGTLN